MRREELRNLGAGWRGPPPFQGDNENHPPLAWTLSWLNFYTSWLLYETENDVPLLGKHYVGCSMTRAHRCKGNIDSEAGGALKEWGVECCQMDKLIGIVFKRLWILFGYVLLAVVNTYLSFGLGSFHPPLSQLHISLFYLSSNTSKTIAHEHEHSPRPSWDLAKIPLPIAMQAHRQALPRNQARIGQTLSQEQEMGFKNWNVRVEIIRGLNLTALQH